MLALRGQVASVVVHVVLLSRVCPMAAYNALVLMHALRPIVLRISSAFATLDSRTRVAIANVAWELLRANRSPVVIGDVC
jgi:hypothetical protein